MMRTLRILAAAAALAFSLGACNRENCGDSCSSDDDCDDGLVCYASYCAPSECESECSHVGLNVCFYNKATCDYIKCN